MHIRWPLYNIPFVKTDFLLSKEAIIHGPLQADCGGRIDGLVKGYVSVTGRLAIGKKAEIIGDVTAKSLKVAGKVNGNILCDDIVVVFNTAIIKGNITAKVIEIKEGARVDGIIIKQASESQDINTPDGEAVTEPQPEEAPVPVEVVPVRSTDKDRDATAWF